MFIIRGDILKSLNEGLYCSKDVAFYYSEILINIVISVDEGNEKSIGIETG
jgi:hypothetical protein